LQFRRRLGSYKSLCEKLKRDQLIVRLIIAQALTFP
jgi:hypothetical protein